MLIIYVLFTSCSSDMFGETWDEFNILNTDIIDLETVTSSCKKVRHCSLKTAHLLVNSIVCAKSFDYSNLAHGLADFNVILLI